MRRGRRCDLGGNAVCVCVFAAMALGGTVHRLLDWRGAV